MADDMKPCFAIEAVPQQKKKKNGFSLSQYTGIIYSLN